MGFNTFFGFEAAFVERRRIDDIPPVHAVFLAGPGTGLSSTSCVCRGRISAARHMPTSGALRRAMFTELLHRHMRGQVRTIRDLERKKRARELETDSLREAIEV